MTLQELKTKAAALNEKIINSDSQWEKSTTIYLACTAETIEECETEDAKIWFGANAADTKHWLDSATFWAKRSMSLKAEYKALERKIAERQKEADYFAGEFPIVTENNENVLRCDYALDENANHTIVNRYSAKAHDFIETGRVVKCATGQWFAVDLVGGHCKYYRHRANAVQWLLDNSKRLN